MSVNYLRIFYIFYRIFKRKKKHSFTGGWVWATENGREVDQTDDGTDGSESMTISLVPVSGTRESRLLDCSAAVTVIKDDSKVEIRSNSLDNVK